MPLGTSFVPEDPYERAQALQWMFFEQYSHGPNIAVARFWKLYSGRPEVFERRVKQLQGYGRPLICTEYLARGAGSTFDTTLPLARKYDVGMINWGFVDGKTQTRYPWDSWQKPYTQSQPVTWHHDVFRRDGKPYRQAEVDLIRSMTAEAGKEFARRRKR